MKYTLAFFLLLPALARGQDINREQFVKLLQIPKATTQLQFKIESCGKVFALGNNPDDPIIVARIQQLKQEWQEHPSDLQRLQELLVLLTLSKDKEAQQVLLTKALVVLTAQLQQHPDTLELQLAKVYVLFDMNQKIDAVKLARDLVKKHPQASDAWGALGDALECKDHASNKEAAEAYKQAIKLQPEEACWHLSYANAKIYEFGYRELGRFVTYDDVLGYRFEEAKPKSQATQKGEDTKSTSSTISDTFIPTLPDSKKSEPLFSNTRSDRQADYFRTVREYTQNAVQLYKKREPENVGILVAVTMDCFIEHCINATTKASYFELQCSNAVCLEIERLVKQRPRDITLHSTRFTLYYSNFLMRLRRDNPVKYDSHCTDAGSVQAALSLDEWQQLIDLIHVAEQLDKIPAEQQASAEHALGSMYILLQKYDKAEPHCAKACKLSPQTNSFWTQLGPSLCRQKKYQECYQLGDTWLKYHPTATSHFALADVASRMDNWKAARQHITSALKLDSSNWKLRLADIIVDIKLDSSVESIARVRARSDKLFEDARRLQPDPQLLPVKESYLTFITVDALSGQFDHAHWLLDYAFKLNERRGDPDLTQALYLLGAHGLKPPSLGGP